MAHSKPGQFRTHASFVSQASPAQGRARLAAPRTPARRDPPPSPRAAAGLASSSGTCISRCSKSTGFSVFSAPVSSVEHANPSPKWVPSLAAQNTGLHNHTNPAKGVALNCSVHRTGSQFISYENDIMIIMGTVYYRPLWSTPLPSPSSLVSLPRELSAAPNLLSPSPSPRALSLAYGPSS